MKIWALVYTLNMKAQKRSLVPNPALIPRTKTCLFPCKFSIPYYIIMVTDLLKTTHHNLLGQQILRLMHTDMDTWECGQIQPGVWVAQMSGKNF
jgi:hypothetical protein